MENFLAFEYLEKFVCKSSLTVLDVIDSTNEYLKRKIKTAENLPNTPELVVAVKQTAGRGTKGRNWIDSSLGLKFSVLYPLKKVKNIPIISPLLALHIRECLASYTDGDISVKWPNDIYSQEGKTVGILIELLEREGIKFLIVGVGINLVEDSRLKTVLKRGIGALKNNISVSDLSRLRTNVLLAVYETVIQSLQSLPKEFTPEQITKWNENDLLRGRVLKLTENETVLFEGKNLGIDKNGRILLQSREETKAFFAGEVSLRI